MGRLAGFVERRRLFVLGVWVVLLLVAAPFAARQSDHLTNGGFEVPGSQSHVVDRNLERFEGAQRESLAVLLAKGEGPDGGDARRKIKRVDTTAARLPHAEVTDAAAATARRQAGDASITIVPLAISGEQDQLADLAADFRDELGDEPRSGVQPYLVGQQALWAGMQELAQEDLEAAETTGFPIVLLILLAVFGSLAAAALPLALGFASVGVTGAAIYFLSQAADMSVFVTNVASMIGIGVAVDYSLFVLARYREEIRAGARPLEARRNRAPHLRAGRRLLRSDGDRRARRAVPDRLHDDPVDGNGRHHRGRRLDPRRRVAAPGSDAASGTARVRPRPDCPDHRPHRAGDPQPEAAGRVDGAGCRARGLLGALDGGGDPPAVGGGGGDRRGPADACDPRPVARVRRPRAASVPGGQSHPRRRRAGRPAARPGRGRADADPGRRRGRDGPLRREPRGALQLRLRAPPGPRGRPRHAAADFPRRRRGPDHGPASSRRGEPPSRSPGRPLAGRRGAARPDRGGKRRRRDGGQRGLQGPRRRLDVEDPRLRPRLQLPRAARAAAVGAPAAEGGSDEPALGRRRLWRCFSGGGSTAVSGTT